MNVHKPRPLSHPRISNLPNEAAEWVGGKDSIMKNHRTSQSPLSPGDEGDSKRKLPGDTGGVAAQSGTGVNGRPVPWE